MRVCSLLAVALTLLLGAAAPQRAAFRFSILGDRTGEAVPGVYEAAWRDIDRLRPNFVINVGDTIQGGNDATADSEWRALRPLFARYRRYPLYLVPGNHDIWSETSEEIYTRETGRPPFYSFDYGPAHFTVLDNSRSLQLSKAQEEFLQRDLAEHRAQRPKFVFFHQPFWLIYLKFGMTAFPLHAYAKEYGVDAVISGHGHQLVHIAQDGITYLEVGSSGGHLRGTGFEDGWFFQHVSVDVNGPKVRMTIHELPAPYGRGRTISLEDWKGK